MEGAAPPAPLTVRDRNTRPRTHLPGPTNRNASLKLQPTVGAQCVA